MAQVSVYNMEGKEVGKMDLLDDIFGTHGCSSAPCKYAPGNTEGQDTFGGIRRWC